MDELPSRELPAYRCHKEVWALKIKDIKQAPADQEKRFSGGDWYLIPEDNDYMPICVGHDEYIVRHKPEPGGYFVIYQGGYESYSPAQPFEDGYTLIS